MRSHIQRLLLIATLAVCAVPSGGCATIVGTPVSPITGGVDLTRQYLSPTELGGRGAPWATPFVFIGGMVAGPFVALYNGVNHDISIFNNWGKYWRDFPDVFKPFEMINEISDPL